MTTELAARPALLSRALLLRFVSIFGASVGFALPLSVVPLYAEQSGAGFVTVALLLATVACELVTPALIRVVGYRWSLAIGLILVMLGAIQKKIFVWHTGFWGEKASGWHYDLMFVLINLVIAFTDVGRYVVMR